MPGPAPKGVPTVLVTVGVDTHLDGHVAVALDHLGRRLGGVSVPKSGAGYARLLRWAAGLGKLQRVGIEGTGSFGAGLARFLRAGGVEVLEVGKPKRRDQHRSGESDPIDAELAARAVLAGTAIGEAKDTQGQAEMIRVLRAARRSAVKARAQVANQLEAMLITAPEHLRDKLRGLSTAKLVRRSAGFHPGDLPEDVASATKLALRYVARRHRQVSEEIRELDGQLKRLDTETAPALVAVHGVGVDTAATLLVAVGEDPKQLKSEAAFANRALHVVAAERMSRDGRTGPTRRSEPPRARASGRQRGA